MQKQKQRHIIIIITDRYSAMLCMYLPPIRVPIAIDAFVEFVQRHIRDIIAGIPPSLVDGVNQAVKDLKVHQVFIGRNNQNLRLSQRAGIGIYSKIEVARSGREEQCERGEYRVCHPRDRCVKQRESLWLLPIIPYLLVSCPPLLGVLLVVGHGIPPIAGLP
jgi:hypothetical protein